MRKPLSALQSNMTSARKMAALSHLLIQLKSQKSHLKYAIDHCYKEKHRQNRDYQQRGEHYLRYKRNMTFERPVAAISLICSTVENHNNHTSNMQSITVTKKSTHKTESFSSRCWRGLYDLWRRAEKWTRGTLVEGLTKVEELFGWWSRARFVEVRIKL